VLDRRAQQLLFAALEVLIQRSRARRQPRGALDLTDARAVEPALGEQLHRRRHQTLAGRGHVHSIRLDRSIRM
jgi:hypothetical protein